MKGTVRVLALLLAVVFVFTSCGGKTTPSESAPDAPVSAAGTPTETKDETDSAASDRAANINPAGEFPIAKEQVELTFAVSEPGDPTDYRTNYFTEQLEELTNVKLNWDYIPGAAFVENVNIMFASGSLPDVLISGVGASSRLDKSRESQLATQGMILPLDELFAEYAPNIEAAFDTQDGLREFLRQPDGKIYNVPTIENAYHSLWSAKYWINDTWLENLGLEYPTNPDELYDVLVAFRDQDPNGNGQQDEIPFSTCKAGNMVALDIFLMNPFTYSPGPDRLYLQDGEVVFTPTQPGYQEGLQYLNKLFSEGLIYGDSFSHDQKTQVAMNENGEDPVLGGWISQHLGYGCDLSVSDKWKQYQSLPPLDGPNPAAPISTYTPYNKYITGHVVLTKDCAEPEAAVRICDYIYTQEGTQGAIVGREGVEWIPAEEGEKGLDGQVAQWKRVNVDDKDPEYQNIKWGQMFPTFRDTDFYSSEAYPQDPYDPEVSPFIGRMVIFQAASREHEAVSQTLESCLPPLAYADDVAAEAVQLKTTIDQYVDEMVAAFTTGNMSPDTDFESFLNELDKMGLPRYLEILQDTYDTTYGS